MIRASDLSGVAWASPAISAPRAPATDRARDAGWFTIDGARISGDLNPAARGLSVQQHANLVLSHLTGRDPR